MTEVSPAGEQSGLLDGEDEVLTPDEAAELLKLSKKTVLRHAQRGELPAAKVGRVWRFRRSELLAFLTSGSA
ncbi:MAG: helix-turn-helix domain-containing protein [Acidimicrobiaceae bacterium]|uniref:helix-turn-helix domain-containing protein n=1 Tax=Candidatus Poriferisodalis multihospitum TaxID=2983191 RepID=UPI00238FF582|nr:helix-turn-helix domain-containing protein [Candidatus Poriferisodalis multihospitum]MDE0497516.1 helix-turn-helix domain-containing protein [Acidimicrobiaceae bacterium]